MAAFCHDHRESKNRAAPDVMSCVLGQLSLCLSASADKNGNVECTCVVTSYMTNIHFPVPKEFASEAERFSVFTFSVYSANIEQNGPIAEGIICTKLESGWPLKSKTVYSHP